MKQVLFSQLNEQVFNIPKILPNNLEKIKKLFSLKNSVIAKNLGFHSNFIGDVVNGKANFSGTSVIKFIKSFNIPFNLIYNINSEAEYNETTQELYVSIVQIPEDDELFNSDHLNGEILKFHLLKKIIDDSDNYFVSIIKEVFPGKRLEFTDEERKENYLYHLELIKNAVENFSFLDTTSRYFIFAYLVTKDKTVNKFINLQENLDNDLMHYLNNIPYVNYTTKTIQIPMTEIVELENETYQLPDSYDFLIGNTIINTNIISKNMYTTKGRGKNKQLTLNIIDTYEIYINKLKQLREYKNYTPQDMAKKLCISSATYVSIEKGHQKLSAQIMWKIEKEFGVLLDQVINIDEYYKKYC